MRWLRSGRRFDIAVAEALDRFSRDQEDVAVLDKRFRFRGIALDNKRPELAEIMGNNIFFDTCVYHQPGIDLLTKVVPVDNILFASEMVGAVKGNDPRTGFGFDDTKRYVEATKLSDADKKKIFADNSLRVYSRLKAQIAKQAA